MKNYEVWHRPDYAEVRFLSVGRKIYRNTAARPDAPILMKIIPARCY